MVGEKGFSARILRKGKGLSRVTNADLRPITAESCRGECDVLVNVLDKSRMACLDSWAVWVSVPLVELIIELRGKRVCLRCPVLLRRPGAVRDFTLVTLDSFRIWAPIKPGFQRDGLLRRVLG